MVESNRNKIEVELGRILDRLNSLPLGSNEYKETLAQASELFNMSATYEQNPTKLETEKARLEAEKIRANALAETEKEKLNAQAAIENAKAELEREKLAVEREKLDSQASIEQARRGIESEKIEAEMRAKQAEAGRSWKQIGITCLTTAALTCGTWLSNARSQARAEYFESQGHTYTSRFSKWLLKEPNKPNITGK